MLKPFLICVILSLPACSGTPLTGQLPANPSIQDIALARAAAFGFRFHYVLKTYLDTPLHGCRDDQVTVLVKGIRRNRTETRAVCCDSGWSDQCEVSSYSFSD